VPGSPKRKEKKGSAPPVFGSICARAVCRRRPWQLGPLDFCSSPIFAHVGELLSCDVLVFLQPFFFCLLTIPSALRFPPVFSFFRSFRVPLSLHPSTHSLFVPRTFPSAAAATKLATAPPPARPAQAFAFELSPSKPSPRRRQRQSEHPDRPRSAAPARGRRTPVSRTYPACFCLWLGRLSSGGILGQFHCLFQSDLVIQGTLSSKELKRSHCCAV
jgi:hypothetical protein